MGPDSCAAGRALSAHVISESGIHVLLLLCTCRCTSCAAQDLLQCAVGTQPMSSQQGPSLLFGGVQRQAREGSTFWDDGLRFARWFGGAQYGVSLPAALMLACIGGHVQLNRPPLMSTGLRAFSKWQHHLCLRIVASCMATDILQ